MDLGDILSYDFVFVVEICYCDYSVFFRVYLRGLKLIGLS